jgi:diguanylate cyclase (GGDEF)-like protein/PAS domain S-box-containing protein
MGIGRSTRSDDGETARAGVGVPPRRGHAAWLALNRLLLRYYERLVATELPGLPRYLLALLFSIIALLARMLIAPPEAGLQFVTFFPAVALVAVFLGPGPALFTTFVCAVAAGYYYFPPYQSVPLEFHLDTVLPILVFGADGVVVSLAIGAMHHYYARYRKTIERLTATLDQGRWQAWELQEREVRYRAVVETARDGFLLVDRGGRVLGANEAYGRLSGYSQAELLTMGIADLDAVERAEDAAARIAGIVAQGDDRFETLHRRKDGSVWPVEITASVNPSLGELFVFARDLTELRAMEAERARSEAVIRDLAFRDPLTQLPNRRLLSDRLRQELAKARRSRRYGALLFIDIDNFKHLNDSLGHDMGDKLLVQVAQRLTDCVREEDTVARMGGDEFVVMLCALEWAVDESARLARQVGEKILEALNRPYQIDSHVVVSTPSIGITLFLDDSEAVDDIFRRADDAMYRVKRSGRNALCFDGDSRPAKRQ